MSIETFSDDGADPDDTGQGVGYFLVSSGM